MTPFGHISINYLAGHWVKRISVPAIVAGALLPDIDWILFFIPSFNQLHRSVTHNLTFVLISSLLPVIFFRKNRGVIFLSLFTGQLIHLFIDSIIDTNISNGTGVQLFWPLSGWYFSPFNLAKASAMSGGWKNPVEMIKTSLPYVIFELPFVIIAFYLILKEKVSIFRKT